MVNIDFYRRFFRRCLTLFLAIAVTISLVACAPNKMLREESRVPQIVVPELGDPGTFNPVTYTTATVSLIVGLTNQQLTDYDPITQKIGPGLAESWEVSEDGLKFVFTLQSGLKWSDGEPLTADDVVFTFNELIFNPEVPSSTRDVLRIGDKRELPQVRQLDDRRIEFTLPGPFAPFMLNTAGISILPAHILRPTIQEKDEQGRLKLLSTWNLDTPVEEIIGSGPFKLKEYVPSQRIVFEKNPYYWEKDEAGNQLPHIDRLTMAIVESLPTATIQFRSGSLDGIRIEPQYFSLFKREQKRGDFTIYNGGPAYGTSFFYFNLNQGSREGKRLVDPIKSRWFNNVKFRQAVAYAVDRETMVNNIFRGLGELQNSNISVQSPFYNENIKSYEYNPEKAKKLLLEAGFKYNSAGELFDDRGNRVTFNLNTNAGNVITREAMAAQIDRNLEQIGIKVDYVALAWNTLIDRITSLNFECVLLGFTGGDEPNNGASIWAVDGNSHRFNQGSTPGRPPIENRVVSDWEREIEALYIQGAKELDFEKRKAIYDRAQDIIAEQLPFIYLVNPFALGAVRNNIENVEFTAQGHNILSRAFWDIGRLRDTSFDAVTEE